MPSTCPATISELASAAADPAPPSNRELKHYLRLADGHRKVPGVPGRRRVEVSRHKRTPSPSPNRRISASQAAVAATAHAAGLPAPTARLCVARCLGAATDGGRVRRLLPITPPAQARARALTFIPPQHPTPPRRRLRAQSKARVRRDRCPCGRHTRTRTSGRTGRVRMRSSACFSSLACPPLRFRVLRKKEWV